MKKVKIITGFTKLSDSELDVKSQEIVSKMTDNPNFAAPIPDINEVKDAKKAYVDP